MSISVPQIEIYLDTHNCSLKLGLPRRLRASRRYTCYEPGHVQYQKSQTNIQRGKHIRPKSPEQLQVEARVRERPIGYAACTGFDSDMA